MRVYRATKGATIFMWIAGLILFVAGIYMLLIPFIEQKHGKPDWPLFFFIMLPFGGFQAIAGLFALLNTIRGRYVIDGEAIYTIGTIPTTRILLTDIKGYRIEGDSRRHVIISAKPGDRKLRISNYLNGTHEIVCWLKANYTNLDTLKSK